MNYKKPHWPDLARPKFERFREMKGCKPLVDSLSSICQSFKGIEAETLPFNQKNYLALVNSKGDMDVLGLVSLILEIKKTGIENFGFVKTNSMPSDLVTALACAVGQYQIKESIDKNTLERINNLKTQIEHITKKMFRYCNTLLNEVYNSSKRDPTLDPRTKKAKTEEMQEAIHLILAHRFIVYLSTILEIPEIENLAKIIKYPDFEDVYALEKIDRKIAALRNKNPIKRMELLRLKYGLICPDALKEIRKQSEIPEKARVIADNPAWINTMQTEILPQTPAPEQKGDNYFRALYPRLTALVLGPDKSSKVNNRLLRKLVKTLESVGIPKEFYTEKIGDGCRDAAQIIEAYTQSSQSCDAVSAKPEKSYFPPAAQKKSCNVNPRMQEDSAQKILERLIFERFKSDLNKLPPDKKTLLEQTQEEIISFIKKYISYLNMPEGERGVFAVNDSANNTSFKEKRNIEGKDPQGWRLFVKSYGSSRIVLSIKIDENKIALYLVETNHSKYSTNLAMLTYLKNGAVRI